MTEEKPHLVAREYVLLVPGVRGSSAVVTRYDNHRSLIPNGQWVARRGEHYTREVDGHWTWQYKLATTFPSAEQAGRSVLRADETDQADKENAS